MKKIILIGAGILAGLTASAQMSVVKEAEKAMKSSDDNYKPVVELITPALTNPETSGLAQTWYIPGKAAFKCYDHLLGLKAFNKLPENGELKMAEALLDGYNYYVKALPLDSVPNEKGKIKPKYSKEIVSTLAGHFGDFSGAGATFYNNQRYNDAYDVWQVMVDMYADPAYRKDIANVDSTLMGDITFNQGIAAWQGENLPKALKAFKTSIALGHNDKDTYNYAIGVASQIPDSATALELAKEALPIYGKEEPSYIGIIINDYLQKKDYQKAFDAINEAIAANPENAQYHMVLGVIYDNDGKRAEAKKAYAKAIELDPYSKDALFNYGKALCEDAYEISDKAPSDPTQIEAYFNENIRPLFNEAADYLERAYNIDENYTIALKYLENVYYNLKDEEKLKYTQDRLNK